MILKYLKINRLPGIQGAFEIAPVEQGIQVIFGPNGIGKSSICRAVEGLYWQSRGADWKTSVVGEFALRGETWRAQREGGDVRWSRGAENAGSPVFPAPQNHHCFFLRLRDLVDLSPDSTQDIAKEIRRQLSGGFDLEEIASNLFAAVTIRGIRTERKRFNDAEQEVRRAENEQAGLRKRADKLKGMKRQLREAEDAAERLPRIERAMRLAKSRDEMARVEDRLAAMPDALAELGGGECKEVEQRQQEVSMLKERAREHRRIHDAAKEEISGLGLDGPLDGADLEAWRNKANELERVEMEFESAQVNSEAAQRKLASALKAVGEGNANAGTKAFNLDEHAKVFEFLRSANSHAAEADAVAERLRLLEGVDAPLSVEQDMDTLRGGADALRRWLSQAEPESIIARTRIRWPWLALSCATLVVAAALAFFVDPRLALLAMPGFGIGCAALFPGGAGQSRSQRRNAQRKLRELGLEEPVCWDASSVSSSLRGLESRIAKGEASLMRSRDRAVELENLRNRQSILAEQKQELDGRRQHLAEALGIDHLPQDAELVDMARALDQLRVARTEFAAAGGQADRHESNHEKILRQLADVLDRYGEPRPQDAAQAKARLNRLADRSARLERALADTQKESSALEQNEEDQARARAEIAAIYAKAGLADGDARGLASLLEALPKYRERAKAKEQLDIEINMDCADLEKVGEFGLAQKNGLSLQDLKAQLDQASSQSSQAQRLRDEIAEVSAQVKQARGSHGLQDRLAAREQARASLRRVRSEALFAAAGNFLLGHVKQAYEQARMPRVYEKARSHFSEFTLNRYELGLRLDAGGDAPRLWAHDLIRRENRELGELSDGTRSQLLLAARIAYAQEVEQAEALPLFLDEALDQSDPRRFEDIARSLGRIADKQKRQIFYLTSDPLDVDRIRHALSKDGIELPDPIDLGRIRSLAESVGEPVTLRVPPAPDRISPEGLTPEEYGALLRVPKFRPAQGYADQHFFYVLSDELAVLDAFLACGLERAGQWKTVAGTELAGKLASQVIDPQRITRRIELLEIFCDLWKQGRGKPVDRDVLTDSGALSERYLEGVVEMAKELGGSPERLLEALGSREDERLRGFRNKSVEQLRNYLIEHEYLDDRPVLDEGELRLRCMATPAAGHLSAAVAAECVRRWQAWGRGSSAEKP